MRLPLDDIASPPAPLTPARPAPATTNPPTTNPPTPNPVPPDRSVLDALLLADGANAVSPAVRLQRIVDRLRALFGCEAVALLRLDGDWLRPVATAGLVRDALGRRFAVGQHPRLAAILARPQVTRIEHDSDLADPYDGLIIERVGEPLAVHDCMGVSLAVEGQPWGVLTLDALGDGRFDGEARDRLAALKPVVEVTLRLARLEDEVRALRLQAGTAHRAAPAPEAGDILGQSEGLVRLLHELQVVAETDLPVLLLGETGVGKELFAHRLHAVSTRRHKPMLHVNCAALPESLAESELFGHVRGAFSGAVADRPGRFEAAQGGTLFLDEVGELPLTVQAKLLRVLQNGEVQRLGADRTRRVDVRLVAATNRRLDELVREGSFRADLYHRLSVYPLLIPPLRERGADVLLLAGRYLELNRARLGLRSLRLSAAAEQALRTYGWPGNVRELEHVISRAALKAISRGARRSDIVTLEPALLDLDGLGVNPVGVPDAWTAEAGSAAAAAADAAGATGATGAATAAGAVATAGSPATRSLRDLVLATQREAIAAALARHHGGWAKAARELRMDASNLRKIAIRLGLKGGH